MSVQHESGLCKIGDGPFCISLQEMQSRSFMNRFSKVHAEENEEASAYSILSKKEKQAGKNKLQGYLIGEESMSFILTFVSYNNATAHSKWGVLIDRVIESDYTRNRKIVIQFDTPIILTQRHE